MFRGRRTDTKKDLSSPRDLRGRRIIFVISTFTLGGAERQAILLARHLARDLGAKVEFWGLDEPGRVSELCDDYNIRWRSAPIPLPWSSDPFTQLKGLARFALTLRSARPDIVLPFMFFPSVICGIIWRLTGARLCIWNQRDEGRDRLAHAAAEWLAVRFTPFFVANSGLGADFLIRKLRINEQRVRMIHNGVELRTPDWDRSQWRNHLGLTDDCFVACMVANLHEFKDHPTLLKAWRIVLDYLWGSNRTAVLLIAGELLGRTTDLKALAYDLKLGKSARFLGAVKDVSGLLGAVDLGIHSSVNEGVPNGVLECMAAGLPVTGTDYPGIREAIGERGSRFLAPPFDSEILAQQIITMILNPKLRAEVGAENRLRIDTEFPPRKMQQQMVNLILEGLGPR